MGIIREGNTIEPISILLLLSAGGYVRWNIGANDLVAMICAGFFVTLATFLRVPTSTSQAIVGAIESDVDKIEWELTKEIFTASLEHSRMLHLRLCLDNIVEISDRAEDAADRLELVTLKSVS